MEKGWLFLVLAIVVEAITEYVKNLVTMGEKKIVILQLSVLGLGVGVCVAANADLFSMLQIDLQIPVLGNILTGVFVSRGANYMSDLMNRLHTGFVNGKEQKNNG